MLTSAAKAFKENADATAVAIKVFFIILNSPEFIVIKNRKTV